MTTPRSTAVRSAAADDPLPLAALQAELAHLFPSEGSLRWEVRVNRRAYVEAGAIVEVAGRLLGRPAVFKKIALELGAKRLTARAALPPAIS